MEIRETTAKDLEDILNVERLAFGYEKEAELVSDLLNDPSAKPILSLLAFEDGKAVGHILFTRAELINTSDKVNVSILAPLAVLPDYQKQGVGGKLIRKGLEILKKRDVELVFVLGHPAYYPKYGFNPAGIKGLHAPYPIPEEHADAWMVQELKTGVIGTVKGEVKCSDELNKPEHWRE